MPKLLIALAATVIFASCAQSKDEGSKTAGNAAASEPPHEIVITADRDSWTTTGVGDVRTGFVSITMETKSGGNGLGVFKFEPEITVEKLIKAFTSGKIRSIEQIENYAVLMGGLVGISDPETHRLTFDLKPGSYGLLDVGGDKAPNFTKGMYESFEVTKETGAETAPESQGSIVMSEYKIELPKDFTANGTYEVRNEGAYYHELNLESFPEGVDIAADIKKLAKTGRSEGKEVTGVWVMAPGTTVYYDLNMPTGTYAALCLLNEPPKAGVHALNGMWTRFTVE